MEYIFIGAEWGGGDPPGPPPGGNPGHVYNAGPTSKTLSVCTNVLRLLVRPKP